MAYTPIFSSFFGVMGGVAGFAIGGCYDSSTRQAEQEERAQQDLSSAAIDSAIADIGLNLGCELDDKSFICDAAQFNALYEILRLGINLLHYYPTAAAMGVAGASIGAALGGVIDCLLAYEQENQYRSRLKY